MDQNITEQRMEGLILQIMENSNFYAKVEEFTKKYDIELENLDYQSFLALIQQVDPNIPNELMENWENLQNIDKMNKQQQQKVPDKKEDESVKNSVEAYKEAILMDAALKANRFVHIQFEIVSGKNFIIEEKHHNPNESLIIFINFLGKRYQSEPVEVKQNPIFNSTFNFNLVYGEGQVNKELMHYLYLCQKIEIAVVIQNEKNQIREILSTKELEWRFILCYPQCKMNIELGKYGEEDQTIGILQINMEGKPNLDPRKLLLEKVVHNYLTKEKVIDKNEIKFFYDSAKLWWNNFKTKFVDLNRRLIKIYAENEFGMFIPLPQFVTPIKQLHGIDNPRQAARFVSLIPHRKFQAKLGQRREIWNKYHTFLVKRQGDIEDHCTLLCSILLGFGMDAYVVVGSNQIGQHTWVMTKEQYQNQVLYTFWESLTAQQYTRQDPKVKEKFKKIGCIFNHQYFYANIQKNDFADSTSLLLNDKQCWWPIDSHELNTLPRYNIEIGLQTSSLNIQRMEDYVNDSLTKDIIGHRAKLPTVPQTEFDKTLQNILKTSLSNYEHLYLHDQEAKAKSQLQELIENYVNNQYRVIFNIQHFSHFEQGKIFQQFQTVCPGILNNNKKQDVQYAVKCKVVPYPENFYIVWVCLALKEKITK